MYPRKSRMDFLYVFESFPVFREGKSEYKIHVYRYSLSFSYGSLHWSQREKNTLFITSMDCFQRCVIETLNTERKSIDSHIYESLHVLFSDIFWIGFERNFYLGSFIKWKTIEYFSYFLVWENGRCSSSEINRFLLSYFIIFPIGEIFSNLIFEVFDISTFFKIIKNRCQCEFAVGTLLSTEGNVDIEMFGCYREFVKSRKSKA